MKVANAETKIIPGHLGPIIGFKEIQQQLEMFAAVRDRVATAIRAGKTVEQVVASKPTADFDQGRMGGAITPDRFVTLVYTDLSRKAEVGSANGLDFDSVGSVSSVVAFKSTESRSSGSSGVRTREWRLVMGQRNLVSGGAMAVTIGFARDVSLSCRPIANVLDKDAGGAEADAGGEEHLDARSHTLGASGPAGHLGLPKRHPFGAARRVRRKRRVGRRGGGSIASGRRSKT